MLSSLELLNKQQGISNGELRFTEAQLLQVARPLIVLSSTAGITAILTRTRFKTFSDSPVFALWQLGLFYIASLTSPLSRTSLYDCERASMECWLRESLVYVTRLFWVVRDLSLNALFILVNELHIHWTNHWKCCTAWVVSLHCWIGRINTLGVRELRKTNLLNICPVFDRMVRLRNTGIASVL